MRTKYIADLMVETLLVSGVERVYGITGDSANHITDAIRRSSIRFIHTRHEEVAAFAAGAEAAATGKLAVCMGSCGPGSLHMVNGLYDAHRNGSPVLAIVTDIDISQIGTNYIQEIDNQNIFRGCSHYCQYVHCAEQFSHIMGIAMQTAISKRGVAVIIISGSISSTEIDGKIQPQYIPNYTKPLITPSESEYFQLKSILDSSARITIFGGAGCIGASQQIRELSHRIKAPVVWSSRAIEALDITPYPAGMTGILGTSAGAHAIASCDTLLILGCGFAFTASYPDDTCIVQIDIAGENLARRHNISLGLVGDIAPTLEALTPTLTARTDDSFAIECTHKYKNAKQHLLKLAEQTNNSKHHIYPEKLTVMLNEKLENDCWITADMGTPWAFATRYIESHENRHLYTSALHGTMACAMPSAIGLSLATDKQVVALCGDGGISMLLGDLLTIKQEKLSPKIFIYNNASLDFVAMEMKADGLLDSFTNLENPNFANVAEAMGIKGIRVEKVSELESAIEDALAYNGAVIVDVLVEGLSMLVPPQITAKMAEKYSLYVAKMVFQGNTEELLEEFMINQRGIKR